MDVIMVHHAFKLPGKDTSWSRCLLCLVVFADRTPASEFGCKQFDRLQTEDVEHGWMGDCGVNGTDGMRDATLFELFRRGTARGCVAGGQARVATQSEFGEHLRFVSKRSLASSL